MTRAGGEMSGSGRSPNRPRHPTEAEAPLLGWGATARKATSTARPGFVRPVGPWGRVGEPEKSNRTGAAWAMPSACPVSRKRRLPCGDRGSSVGTGSASRTRRVRGRTPGQLRLTATIDRQSVAQVGDLFIAARLPDCPTDAWSARQGPVYHIVDRHHPTVRVSQPGFRACRRRGSASALHVRQDNPGFVSDARYNAFEPSGASRIPALGLSRPCSDVGQRLRCLGDLLLRGVHRLVREGSDDVLKRALDTRERAGLLCCILCVQHVSQRAFLEYVDPGPGRLSTQPLRQRGHRHVHANDADSALCASAPGAAFELHEPGGQSGWTTYSPLSGSSISAHVSHPRTVPGDRHRVRRRSDDARPIRW